MTSPTPIPSPPPQNSHVLSPPPSPSSDDELPIIPTDDRGMVISHDKVSRPEQGARAVKPKTRRGSRRRQPIKYVSRHFSTEDAVTPLSTRPEIGEGRKPTPGPATPPHTPAKRPARPRIFYGLNVDELSSDSDLTDVPDDIGPDPFISSSPLEQDRSQNGPRKTKTKANAKTKTPYNALRSPFFPNQSPHRHRSTFLSTLPFPPLSAERFGLMQERLAHDPFRLLIATIFLNKTPGERAMPVFFQLMERYPTPEDLAKAEVSDVTEIIRKLGFQNQRARKCVAMAQKWVEKGVEKGVRYRKLNYPGKGDGRDVKEDEVLKDEREGEGRVGWEISHLPGVGAYAHDSWRIFCRDRLRGMAEGWDGEGAEGEEFKPEWKRVLPLDKELRAWMTWMWLKEGWVWNKETGKRTRASKELMEMASEGGIVVEEREKETLTVKAVERAEVERGERKGEVARPAGEVMENVKLERPE